MQKNNDPGSRNARRFTAKWFLHPANMVLIVTFTMTLGWFLRTYNVFCRNGTQIKKFPTGEIQSEVNFRNGRRNGTARLWLRNGCLLEEKEYLDGKLNGLARAWNGDGQLALEDEWSMGEKVRDTFFFRQGGEERVYVGQYKDGKMWDGKIVRMLKGPSPLLTETLITYSNGIQTKSTPLCR